MSKINTSERSVEDSAERISEIRQASMCRLCFRNKYLVSIGSDERFIDQLANCLHQKPTKDSENLPEFVCGECYQLVEAMNQFKTRCNRASKIIKRFIRKGGEFPDHDMLEFKPRRTEKRAASSLTESSSKRRRTTESIIEDEKCSKVGVDQIVTNLDKSIEVTTEIDEQNNPQNLVEKFDELFGAGSDMDLPGLLQILANTPPISPAEKLEEKNSIESQHKENFSISTTLAPVEPINHIQNSWIDALEDEVLYSIMLNQLLENLASCESCRSYTSYVEKYVELQ